VIDGLIAGTLHAAPERKTSQSGRGFVTARIRAAAHNGETVFVSVVAFDAAVGEMLLSMGAGESVAVAGSVTPKAWLTQQGEPRCGLDVVAHALLTPYHVRRRREAASGARGREKSGGKHDGW
jgi:single-stranded DNA-binding protein